MVNLLNLAGDETVKAILPVRDFDSGDALVFATKKGTVKRSELALYKNIRSNGLNAIKLDPGDDLIAVRLASADDHVLLFTRQGKSIRFAATDARAMGREARGVRGITLRAGDCVVGMEVLKPTCEILAVTERGFGKRTDADEYRLQRRGGTGILAMRVSAKVGFVVGMLAVRPDDELLLSTARGTTLRIPVSEIRKVGRVTQGVKLMNVDPEERLVAVDVLAERDSDEEEPSDQPGASA